MSPDTARILLDTCERDELIDRTFGDREVIWRDRRTGNIVATGYFGGNVAEISLLSTPQPVYLLPGYDGNQHDFVDEAAHTLARRGHHRMVNYNDTPMAA